MNARTLHCAGGHCLTTAAQEDPLPWDRRGSRGKGGEGSARSSNGCRVMQLRRSGACEGRSQDGLGLSTSGLKHEFRGFWKLRYPNHERRTGPNLRNARGHMNHSDTIPLPATEARCRPTSPGIAATSCARALATAPKQYATLADFSAVQACSALCSGYINVQSLRMAAAADAPKPAVPVRPAVRGIA